MATIINKDTLWCPRCKQLLDKSAFARDKHKKSGYCWYCRECKRERHYIKKNMSKPLLSTVHIQQAEQHRLLGQEEPLDNLLIPWRCPTCRRVMPVKRGVLTEEQKKQRKRLAKKETNRIWAEKTNHNAKRRVVLTDEYAKKYLENKGWASNHITPEMIAETKDKLRHDWDAIRTALSFTDDLIKRQIFKDETAPKELIKAVRQAAVFKKQILEFNKRRRSQ